VGYNLMSLIIMIGTALAAYFARLHPLWIFAAAAVIGMSGLL
jgi:hypothetical protein